MMRRLFQRLTILIAFSVLAIRGTDALAGSRFLILCGSGGEESYRQKFNDWGTKLKTLLVQQLNYPADAVRLLMETPPTGETAISLESIRIAFQKLTKESTTEDDAYVILIGHGSYLRREAKFNIPGPDLVLAEFGSLLKSVPARRAIVIDSTSSSAAFINELSAPNRIIVTATKSVAESNATSFMEFFIQGLQDGSADQNRDERISLLEACRQASSLTEAWYVSKGITPTEHAILDDNGDALGTRILEIGSKGVGEGEPMRDPGQEEDGSAAAVCFIRDFSFPPSVPKPLSDRYLKLLGQIEQLKSNKRGLAADVYTSRLETLLIDAAQTNREIHKLSASAEQPIPPPVNVPAR